VTDSCCISNIFCQQYAWHHGCLPCIPRFEPSRRCTLCLDASNMTETRSKYISPQILDISRCFDSVLWGNVELSVLSRLVADQWPIVDACFFESLPFHFSRCVSPIFWLRMDYGSSIPSTTPSKHRRGTFASQRGDVVLRARHSYVTSAYQQV
jgi:hypothetical protein